MSHVVNSPERSRVPLVLHWQEPDRPLPVRAVRWPAGSNRHATGVEAPPWHATGPLDRPFDFIGHVRRLCSDICRQCAELRHIDTRRILFDMTQARNSQAHGLQARVTPLRFRHGQLRRTRQQVVYQVQRYLVDGNEMLYLVTFCLPRFLDQSFDEKFITLFHELYHISPEFEGDLRRLDGRNHLHADSKQAYDRHMAHLARQYLASKPDPVLHGFLRLNFAQLVHRHKRVEAVVVPRPRLIPVGKVSDLCGLETAS